MSEEEEDTVVVVDSAGIDDIGSKTIPECSASEDLAACLAGNVTSGSTSGGEDLDVTKITVLSLITILTVLGNVCVILAILCR